MRVFAGPTARKSGEPWILASGMDDGESRSCWIHDDCACHAITLGSLSTRTLRVDNTLIQYESEHSLFSDRSDMALVVPGVTCWSNRPLPHSIWRPVILNPGLRDVRGVCIVCQTCDGNSAEWQKFSGKGSRLARGRHYVASTCTNLNCKIGFYEHPMHLSCATLCCCHDRRR
jgi:hypothetical protein